MHYYGTNAEDFIQWANQFRSLGLDVWVTEIACQVRQTFCFRACSLYHIPDKLTNICLIRRYFYFLLLLYWYFLRTLVAKEASAQKTRYSTSWIRQLHGWSRRNGSKPTSSLVRSFYAPVRNWWQAWTLKTILTALYLAFPSRSTLWLILRLIPRYVQRQPSQPHGWRFWQTQCTWPQVYRQLD